MENPNMKILVVDDETISRKVLLKKLKPLGECTALDDGQKALDAFKKGSSYVSSQKQAKQWINHLRSSNSG